MSLSAEERAQQVLAQYIDAFNTGDVDQVRAVMHFPLFLFRPTGEHVVVPRAEDWQIDFTGIREREGWHHSVLTGVRVVATSPGKIETLLRADRYRADGTCYRTLGGLYILTNVGDRWGIQVNAGFAEPPAISD
jgi:hypothetical protein